MSDQIAINSEAYEKIRAELEAEHFGRCALMHDGKVIGIYNDSGDAYSIGVERYALGNFSLMKIGEKPISLGIFTLCLPGARAELAA